MSRGIRGRGCDTGHRQIPAYLSITVQVAGMLVRCSVPFCYSCPEGGSERLHKTANIPTLPLVGVFVCLSTAVLWEQTAQQALPGRQLWAESESKLGENRKPQTVSIVQRQDADSSERVLMDMRWGLVPSWFKQDNPSKLQFNTSNCRSDTMLSKSSYKGALLKGKRCVVLADGFYEWQQQSGGKQPYFIYFPQTKDTMDKETQGDEEWKGWRLLTMAGIFDCWEPPGGGEMLYTYTIITVDASKDVSFIHHRMPAILDGDEAIRKWLDFAEVPTQEAVKLIQPTENIVFHPVSTFVNNIRNNAPECVAPVELGVKKVGTGGGLAGGSSAMVMSLSQVRAARLQEEWQ
uniref:Abasic site processing protein HMCES n=1 Tax=Cyanistes caeruleus TaxID=156563 RepID=A0A8C0U536_CYACU